MPTPSEEVVWDLPPLILHPFNEHTPPSVLLDNSKAALMLSGLIPDDGSDPEDLSRRVLAGRYSEIRMLFFLGKDVFRWLEQCVDWVTSIAELQWQPWPLQRFAPLLTVNPPAEVKEKMARWGVADYAAIFRRAIGMNALFVNPPVFADLNSEFLRNYHKYADAMYECFVQLEPCPPLAPPRFRFAVYASGEYSRMLESQWDEGE